MVKWLGTNFHLVTVQVVTMAGLLLLLNENAAAFANPVGIMDQAEFSEPRRRIQYGVDDSRVDFGPSPKLIVENGRKQPSRNKVHVAESAHEIDEILDYFHDQKPTEYSDSRSNPKTEANAVVSNEEELGFYYPLLMSCLAGASTGIGALFVFLLDKNPSGSHLAFSLSLAAGVMLSVSVADMWIPLGATTFQILEHFLPSQEDSVILPQYTNTKRHDRKYNAERTRNFRLALVMMLTLTAHNFPEGLAVSVSNMKHESHGVIVTVAIAVHNIPEGLAIATPFFAATGNRYYSVMMAFLSGLSEPLGAFVALTLLRPLFREYPWLVDYVLVFVAGVMVAVSFLELLPEARQYRKPQSVILGFISGSIIMLVTMMYV